jgi:hypothetical protein
MPEWTFQPFLGGAASCCDRISRLEAALTEGDEIVGIRKVAVILTKRGTRTGERREYYGSRRDQDLFDTDLTLLHNGERVSFAKRLQVYGVRCDPRPGSIG